MKINHLFHCLVYFKRPDLDFIEDTAGSKKLAKLGSRFKLKSLIFMEASLLFFTGCSKISVQDLAVEKPVQAVGEVQLGSSISTTVSLKPQSQKIDLLLVLDDSPSMRPESLALASKLESFIQKLESASLDWQMCWTTTDTYNLKGQSLPWVGVQSNQNWILRKGEKDLNNRFVSTIDQHSFSGSGDERGVYAMDLHLKLKNSNSCYRDNAAFAVIAISDEDERSVGGIQSLNPNQYVPIEIGDSPENYLNDVRSVLGANVAHTVHSIVIPPGDQSCFASQNDQASAGYFGTFYERLSMLTGGSVASICSPDYSQNLSQFADKIQKSFQRVKLECEPDNNWKVTTVPEIPNLIAHADGLYLDIESPLKQETLVSVEYLCKQ